MNSDHIRVVAFDADDTLWENGPMFRAAGSRFISMFSDDMSSGELEKKLLSTEIKNLKTYGYGVKSFVLSMIETAVEIRGGVMDGAEISAILDIDTSSFLMVGDSLKSDVLPVVGVGGHAVHIPTRQIWEHEHVEPPRDLARPYLELGDIRELPPLL